MKKKKLIRIVLLSIICLYMVPLFKHCGEITNEPFAYGILWCITTDLILEMGSKNGKEN